jgi:hypothetical protein
MCSTGVGTRPPAEIGLRRLLLAAEAAVSWSIMSVMSSGLSSESSSGLLFEL